MPAVHTEVVPCPLCGESATRPLSPGEGWAMGRCRGCGFVRQNPRVTADWVRRQEYDVERADTVAPRRSRTLEATDLAAWETKPQAAYQAGVVAVTDRLPATAPRGLWIDVGCQTGGMLVAARQAGFEVAGCDVDAGSAAVARSHHGADVRAGTLTEARFPSACAAVVSYRQVLEHVHDLAAELAEVRRVLTPGGLLLVEVPHQGGVRYRIDVLRVALRLMPRRGLFHNVPQHLYYFRGRDLERLLAAHGFEVLTCGTYGRFRERRSRRRRLYEAVRDRLRLGNKLRVVARRDARG